LFAPVSAEANENLPTQKISKVQIKEPTESSQRISLTPDSPNKSGRIKVPSWDDIISGV
jgi:hypothetical protein